MHNIFEIYKDTYLGVIEEQVDIEFSHLWDDLNSLKALYDKKDSITKGDIVYLFEVAINDEMLATYNYLASYMRSVTEGKADFDPEFKAHEKEEYEHLHLLLGRLHEIEPNDVLITKWCDIMTMNATGKKWKQEFSQNSAEIISNRYKEELNAIDFYSFFLSVLERQVDDKDTTTIELIKKIKADEETHAKDLRDLITEHRINFNDSIIVPTGDNNEK